MSDDKTFGAQTDEIYELLGILEDLPEYDNCHGDCLGTSCETANRCHFYYPKSCGNDGCRLYEIEGILKRIE